MRRHTFSKKPPGRRSDAGFALLLVLGLLSLVVLVLVSLATFTKVETSVVGISQQQAKARQNALFALNQAVGLLQRSAGPDTRVTATAELLRPTVTGEQRNVTGVWDTATNGLVTWLVNGNDSDFGTLPINSVVPTDVLIDPDSAAGANWVWMLKKGVQRTDGTILRDADRVRIQKSPIQATGIPGFPQATQRTIGRYAFWVADEGVKHSLGMWDRTFLSNEDQITQEGQRNRIPNLTWSDAIPQRDFSQGAYGIDRSVMPTATSDEFDTFGDYNRQRTRQLVAQEGRIDFLLDAMGGYDQRGTVTASDDVPRIGVATGIDILRSPYRDRVLRRGDLLATAPRTNPLTTALYSDTQRSDIQNTLNTLLANNYHAISEQTFGVLADTVNGGLRGVIDNTAIHVNRTGTQSIKVSRDPLANGHDAAGLLLGRIIPGRIGVAAYVTANNVFPTVNGTFDPIRTETGIFRPINPDTGAAFNEADFGLHDGAPVYLVSPVIVKYTLRLRFDDDNPTGNGLAIQATTISLEVDLWNPYSSALQIPNLQILLRNLPNLTLVDSDLASFTVDLQTQVPGLTAITLPAQNTSVGFDYFEPGQIRTRTVTLGPVTLSTPISGPVAGGFASVGWAWPGTAAQKNQVAVLLADGAGNPLRAYDQVSWRELPLTLVDPADAGVDFQWRIKGPRDDFIALTARNATVPNPDGQPEWLALLDPNSPTIAANALPPGIVDGSRTGSLSHAYFYGDPSYVSGASLPGFTGIPDAFANTFNGRYVLYDLPRQAPLSVGSLRHLGVMPRTIGGERTNAPAYAIGSPATIAPAFTTVTPAVLPLAMADLMPDAGTLNAYFDQFYVTALPATELAANESSSTYQGGSFPNSNLQVVSTPILSTDVDRRNLFEDIARGGRNTSRYLLIRNAFNINSTSVPAWRALLAGALFAGRDVRPQIDGIPDDYWRYYDGSTTVSAFDTAPTNYYTFPDGTPMWTKGLHNLWFRTPQGAQFLGKPITPTFFQLRGKADLVDRAHQLGIRPLTPLEIDLLAQAIVSEIRSITPMDWDKDGQFAVGARRPGEPFLSLNQFITSGVLERAITLASCYDGVLNNGGLTPPKIGFVTFPNAGVAGFTIPGTALPNGLPIRAPFTLTQNDLLERLAPVLSARSDTFVIRAYGESGNPAEDPDDSNRDFSTGEAWLEAVVQRFPDYIDRSDDGFKDRVTAEDNKEVTDALTTANLQSATNKALGRKFRILSVRWLAPNEI